MRGKIEGGSFAWVVYGASKVVVFGGIAGVIGIVLSIFVGRGDGAMIVGMVVGMTVGGIAGIVRANRRHRRDIIWIAIVGTTLLASIAITFAFL